MRLHSPAAQCPSAPAADWELLGSRCPNTLQMPGKIQGSTACTYHVELHAFFFLTQVPCKLCPQALSQGGDVGFVDYPSAASQFSGKKESTRSFFSLLWSFYSLFIASCSSFLVLMSWWVIFLLFFFYINHLGSFVTQFNTIVTTNLVWLHVILAGQISLLQWHGFGETPSTENWMIKKKDVFI